MHTSGTGSHVPGRSVTPHSALGGNEQNSPSAHASAPKQLTGRRTAEEHVQVPVLSARSVVPFFFPPDQPERSNDALRFRLRFALFSMDRRAGRRCDLLRPASPGLKPGPSIVRTPPAHALHGRTGMSALPVTIRTEGAS